MRVVVYDSPDIQVENLGHLAAVNASPRAVGPLGIRPLGHESKVA